MFRAVSRGVINLATVLIVMRQPLLEVMLGKMVGHNRRAFLEQPKIYTCTNFYGAFSKAPNYAAGYLIVQKAGIDSLQFFRHHQQTLNGFLNVSKRILKR
jgi:hypothetical protein